MNVLFFVIVLGFAVFETIIVYFTKENYGWDVVENGWLFAASSFITVLALLLLKPVQTLASGHANSCVCCFGFWADDRAYLLAGIVGMLLAMVCPMYSSIVAWISHDQVVQPRPLPIVWFLVGALACFSPFFPVAQSTCFILSSKILGPGGMFFI